MSIRHIAVLALALSALAARAGKQPLSRYQSIIDRQMFGELPAGFDPTKMPSEVQRSSGKQGQELTKEQEKLQSSIHFSAINVTPDGVTAVGFTDNSNPKTPVHYYLKEGETRDGWKVTAADAKAATMTIAKDDIEVSLSLGGNSGKGGGTTSRAGAGEQAGGSGMLRTLRGRRALREKREAEALQKIRDEAAAKDAEREALAAEDKAQREAEREEQRKQLMAIQEELRRAREEKAQQRQQSDEDSNNEVE